MSKVTQYYRNNTLHIYSYFKPENCDNLDYSEKAVVEMFKHESLGKEINTKTNGYYHCKRNLDITLSNWTETLKEGLTTKYEIMSNYENDQVMYDFVKDFLSKVYIPSGAYSWVRETHYPQYSKTECCEFNVPDTIDTKESQTFLQKLINKIKSSFKSKGSKLWTKII